MSVQTAPPALKNKHVTYEEYRALPEDGKLYSVVEGELFVTAAPLIDRQRASGNLQFILETYIRAQRWGRLFAAPVEVYLGPEDFVQPDLVCISRDRETIIKEWNIEGAPDLIGEILSPTTARYDRVSKAKAYARHQVLNYWLVDPAAHTLEAFEWENGTYRLAAAQAEDESFEPALFPNLKISLGDLWK